MLLKFERKSCYFFFILKSKSFQFFCKATQEEYAKLLAEKKAAYAEYRRSRDEMRELLLHKQNVDRMLGKNEREEEKKKEHDRQ